MQCPDCGHDIEKTAKFCHECGRPFAAGTTETASAATAPDPAPGAVEPAEAADPADATPAPEYTDPYASKLVASASAAFDAGQLVPAETICKQALQLQPENAAAHQLLADILEQRGNAEGAAAERSEALKIEKSARRSGALWSRVSPRALQGLGALALVVCLAAVILSFKNGASGPDTSSMEPSGPSGANTAAIAPPLAPSPARTAVGPSVYPRSAAGNVSADPEALVTAPVMGAGAATSQPIGAAPLRSAPVAPAAGPAAVTSVPAPRFVRTAPQMSAALPDNRPVVPPIYPAVVPRVRPARRPRISPPSGAASGGTERPTIISMGEDSAATSDAGGGSFEVRLARARAAYEAQRYSEAIPAYRSALLKAPSVLDSATTRQELAMAYSALHSPHEASSEFRAAESEYASLLSGPNAARAREAIKNIRAQLQLPENRE